MGWVPLIAAAVAATVIMAAALVMDSLHGDEWRERRKPTEIVSLREVECRNAVGKALTAVVRERLRP